MLPLSIAIVMATALRNATVNSAVPANNSHGLSRAHTGLGRTGGGDDCRRKPATAADHAVAIRTPAITSLGRWLAVTTIEEPMTAAKIAAADRDETAGAKRRDEDRRDPERHRDAWCVRSGTSRRASTDRWQ